MQSSDFLPKSMPYKTELHSFFGGVGLEGRTPGNLIVIVSSKEINISNSSVKKTIFVLVG